MAAIVKVSSPRAVASAVKVLKRGGLIAIPTETCYGLGADATNPKAVAAVFKVKRRVATRKMSVMVADKAMANRFFGRSRRVDALIDAFLPGPLTIVTKGRSFRIPDYAWCRRLIKKLGRPITSTSSNVSGGSNHYSIKPILRELKGVDLIIDGGCLPKRLPSTVYDVDHDKVLRKGPLSEKEIRLIVANL